jgi:hypothetical protein
MEISERAIKELKNVRDRLEQNFQKVWGILPISSERDEIMHYLFTAKHKLNQFIKEHDNHGNI